jgi:hypothetical protein
MAPRKMAQLEADCDEASLESLLRASSSLSFLSLYYGARGEVAMLDDSAGRSDILRSLYYRFWEVRVRVGVASRRAKWNGVAIQPRLLNHLPIAASLVLAFLLFRDRARAELMADALKFILERGSERGAPEQEDRSLVSFALWVHDRCAGTPSSDQSGDLRGLGIYTEVARNWGTTVVAESLPALREYHLSRVDDDGDGPIPPFKWAPFDGIPFEILAIISLNEGTGVHFATPDEMVAINALLGEHDDIDLESDPHIQQVGRVFDMYVS